MIALMIKNFANGLDAGSYGLVYGNDIADKTEKSS